MNKNLQAILLAVCILLGTVCGPLAIAGFPVAHAASDYSYTWVYNWHFHGGYAAYLTDVEIEQNVSNGMNVEAAQQFAAQMAQSGHWYKVDSVNTNTVVGNKTGNPYGVPEWEADFSGVSTVNFETDINEPSASGTGTHATSNYKQTPNYELLGTVHVQPLQIEEALIAILLAVLTALVTYPWLAAIVIIVGLILIGYWVITAHGGLGSLFGPGIGGEIIEVIVIIGIIIALVLTAPALADRYLPKKKGVKN